MSLQPGARLTAYQILGLIGSGGMGKVYRARDTKLNRDVALKVLPEEFALDADRLARFKREAQVLASLNHPNIAAIYGLEEADGVRALVLEFVEGPTLADRIAQGPIPLDEALPIARQVADALEAAHEHGIIHRDLKPSNIKVRTDGTVKVLDFGLAKALDLAPASDLSQSPTMTSPAMTGMGVILGTAAYMSPEQAKGRPVDKRADIWAFGCVLYEMLTGRRAFQGEAVSDTLATVLKSDPSWSALPSDLPPAIRRLLRRCLTKDSKGRIGDASTARIEIDEVQRGPYVDGEMVQKTPRHRERLAWISILALVALIAVVLGLFPFRPPSAAPERRLEITTPPTTHPMSLAISPDGQKIVFAATSQGRSQLWLRALDSVSARPLAGTDGASLPFWSPDSRSVGFFTDIRLQRIDIDGGSVRALANAEVGYGGAWNNDGVILFSPAPANPIFRIPATGGEPAAVTRLETPHQQHHYFPQFLPDGRHFLYHVLGSPEARGVYVGRLDGSQTRRLLDADAPAVYASSGHLLFVRQGTLFAQQLDPVPLALTEKPFPVAERVTVGYRLPVAALSTSAAGPLVYRSGSAEVLPQLVWFDRSGKEIGKVGSPDSAGVISPSLSRDDRRVALFRFVNGNVDVWVLELGRSVVSRFTSDAAEDVFPKWSPDDTRIVFSSNRKGTFDLYQKPADGAGNEELLLATSQRKRATDWSLDGRFLLYGSADPKMGTDIWALPMDGDRKPFPVVQTDFEEGDGQFSPDGKWIAYRSNESGRFEIYVQPFPGPGGKSLMSTTGGRLARWRHDGKELFYIALDNRLMAVPIQLASNGQAVEAGAPVPLFAMRVGGQRVMFGGGDMYMVSSAGQRFLISALTEEAASPITVILNSVRAGPTRPRVFLEKKDVIKRAGRKRLE
jgi:serine/threonine protein kinase